MADKSLYEEDLYECYDIRCDDKFKDFQALFKHLKIFHDETIICRYDNCKATVLLKVIGKHITEFHEKVCRQEMCPYCERRMSQWKLLSHVEECIDDDNRNFSCSVEGCESKFFTKWCLDNHIGLKHAPIASPIAE